MVMNLLNVSEIFQIIYLSPGKVIVGLGNMRREQMKVICSFGKKIFIYSFLLHYLVSIGTL
jgi:hypothetical protein